MKRCEAYHRKALPLPKNGFVHVYDTVKYVRCKNKATTHYPLICSTVGKVFFAPWHVCAKCAREMR